MYLVTFTGKSMALLICLGASAAVYIPEVIIKPFEARR